MAWITSRHAIFAALKRGVAGTLYLVGTGGKNRELMNTARSAGVRWETVSASWLRTEAGPAVRGAALRSAEIEGGETVVQLETWLAEHGADRSGLVVALDHVTDPHKLGAILRSSLIHSVDLVLIPSRRSATGGDTVLRTSAGASRFVPVAYVGNLRSALSLCREAGWWLYAADADGTPLPRLSFNEKAVLILGAEGKGVSPVVRKASDEVMTIPGGAPADSGVDSFNVSVAAGICLYEFRRQHPTE